MNTTGEIRAYLSTIGRKGGQKSRRKLSTSEASKMVLVREARRAFNRFRSSCFWSYKMSPQITFEQVDLIIRTLKKNGGRDAWLTSAKLQQLKLKCL